MRLTTILWIFALLLVVSGCFDFYLETKGQNYDEARWCESQGLIVRNEIDFLYEFDCYKIEDGVMNSYLVKESADDIGEVYDYKHKYYLIKRGEC